MLIHTGVANYMEFKPVDGSYVYRKSSTGGKIYKVPTTPKEAMKSGLLGMVEKGRMAQFTAWVDSVKLEDRATWCSKGMTGSTKLPLDTMSGAWCSARTRSGPHRQPAAPLGLLRGLAEPPRSPPQAPSFSNSGSSTRRPPSSSRTHARSTATTATFSAPRTRSSNA